MLSKKAEKRSSHPIYPAIIQFAWRSSNVQWDQEQDVSRSIFHSSLHFSIQWFPLRPRPLDSTRFTDLPTLLLVVILLGFKQRTYLPTVSRLISMNSVVEFDGTDVIYRYIESFLSILFCGDFYFVGWMIDRFQQLLHQTVAYLNGKY